MGIRWRTSKVIQKLQADKTNAGRKRTSLAHPVSQRLHSLPQTLGGVGAHRGKPPRPLAPAAPQPASCITFPCSHAAPDTLASSQVLKHQPGPSPPGTQVLQASARGTPSPPSRFCPDLTASRRPAR